LFLVVEEVVVLLLQVTAVTELPVESSSPFGKE
jgi:hypothetical protein